MYKTLYQECQAENNTSNTKFILPNAKIYSQPPQVYDLDQTLYYSKNYPLYSTDNFVKKDLIQCNTATCTAAAAAEDAFLRPGSRSSYRYASKDSPNIIENYYQDADKMAKYASPRCEPDCSPDPSKGCNKIGFSTRGLPCVSKPQNARNYNNCKNCAGI